LYKSNLTFPVSRSVKFKFILNKLRSSRVKRTLSVDKERAGGWCEPDVTLSELILFIACRLATVIRLLRGSLHLNDQVGWYREWFVPMDGYRENDSFFVFWKSTVTRSGTRY